MLGAISDGITEIDGFLMGEDCLSTIDCFRKMGIRIDILDNKVMVHGNGLYGVTKPKEVLYTGNSGTTTRLLSGILAGQDFTSCIDGDQSIRKRPMNRVVEPLRLMGASIEGVDNGNFVPLNISGRKLKGITYHSPISSAQVKSCILLASLYTDGETVFSEPSPSRNHTELMMEYFGGKLKVNDNIIANTPVSNLNAQHVYVPGDISSAAFFITLALICPNSEITIKNVGINPTRSGILDIYKQMGAKIKIENIRKISNEMVADITTSSSELCGIEIGGEIIPRLIDEIPIIAVAATQARGTTVVKDAAELKVKESNRIRAIVTELKKMGAKIEETADGMIIEGPTPLRGAIVESYNDHRIAMSMAIAGNIASGETTIVGHECVDISFPGFFELLERVSR